MRTFASTLALVVGLGVLAAACATAGDDTAADDSAVSNLWVSQAVKEQLLVTNPSDQGKSWAITSGNALRGDWLLQMPRIENWGKASIPAPKACSDAAHCDADFNLVTCATNADCGGGSCTALAADGGKLLCTGHSDAVLDDIYGVITGAHVAVDVTSLTEPRGKYMAAMRNALTALDKRGEHITARFLFGSYPDNTPDLAKILTDLTRDLGAQTKLDVSVGAHQNSPTSWNHSKIVAADGKEAIVGGMNLWDAHYLESDPVHDVSIRLQGPAATTAQTFANQLWGVACGNRNVASNRNSACPTMFTPTAASAASVGNVHMIPVGRLGTSFHNASDTALVAMMDTAQSTIKISQQDIGSVKVVLGGVLPDAYLDAWTRAARRGVDVTVIVSNDNAYGGGGHASSDAYFNGWSLQDLWNGLIQRADQQWPDSHPQLCQHLHFAHMRGSANATWKDGMPYANHAKVVIVDDQAHYVGSQNLYDANLAEFGVIVDDQPSTRQFLSDYWAKLAQYSLSTTYVDPECR